MRSKIIINIVIGYFIILSIVLVLQLKSKDIVANEPISSDITVEDKIKNSTILFVGSPFYIMNEKQSLIDNDLSITPTIINGKVYIPIRFIANAYNATINFSKSTKDLTVRLNNKAIIFYNEKNKIKVIDNISEEIQEIEATPEFINDRIYIPLRSFAQAFEKEVFYYNDLIVISNINDIFDPMEEIDLISNISNQVKNLPTINTQEKLIEILNSNKFTEVTSNKTAEDNTSEKNEALENSLENSDEKTFIKQLYNIDFYLFENALYGYKDDDLFCEIVLPNSNNENYIVEDIFIFEQNLVVIYNEEILEDEEPSFYVSIYNGNNVRTEKINGLFSKINFHNKIFSIISTQDATLTNADANYITPTLNFATGQKANFEDITYFPELNTNLYTTVTNINITDEKYLFKKVFFGAGINITYYNNYLYFITEKDDFSFIHSFKINDSNLEYINRIYLKGKIITLDFEDDNNIKVTTQSEDEELSYSFDRDLKILN